jgi:hypothetical protein
METSDWSAHLEKLEAQQKAADEKKLKKEEPFVKIPVRAIEEVAEAINDNKLIVLGDLLYRRFQAHGAPFAFPNTRLEKPLGVNVARVVKHRVLRGLEAAGIITVDRRKRKSPVVTWSKL